MNVFISPANPQRKVKIWGKTAVPLGRYRIAMEYSPKFGKQIFFAAFAEFPILQAS